jgi:hypothetical protein
MTVPPTTLGGPCRCGGGKIYRVAVDCCSVNSFRRKQLLGILGALPGFIVVGWVILHAGSLFSSTAMTSGDSASRMAFAVGWMSIPGLCLLLGVIIAARRGFVADAIDGTRTPASHSLEINLRYNQNTVEQTLLACIAWMGLAICLPPADLVLIPAMATLFAIGRVTFWIGYLIHPMARSFGMVLTVLPTLGSYAWLIWHLKLQA